jgi:hypothetical protein
LWMFTTKTSYKFHSNEFWSHQPAQVVIEANFSFSLAIFFYNSMNIGCDRNCFIWAIKKKIIKLEILANHSHRSKIRKLKSFKIHWIMCVSGNQRKKIVIAISYNFTLTCLNKVVGSIWIVTNDSWSVKSNKSKHILRVIYCFFLYLAHSRTHFIVVVVVLMILFTIYIIWYGRK